jgi:hypothetical protein
MASVNELLNYANMIQSRQMPVDRVNSGGARAVAQMNAMGQNMTRNSMSQLAGKAKLVEMLNKVREIERKEQDAKMQQTMFDAFFGPVSGDKTRASRITDMLNEADTSVSMDSTGKVSYKLSKKDKTKKKDSESVKKALVRLKQFAKDLGYESNDLGYESAAVWKDIYTKDQFSRLSSMLGVDPDRDEIKKITDMLPDDELGSTFTDWGKPEKGRIKQYVDEYRSKLSGGAGAGDTENPYKEEYPDAFLEGGVWKVVRNGQKYRISE